MEDIRELLEEMRETFKSGHHKQVLAQMDDEISFGKVSPILRAVFQFEEDAGAASQGGATAAVGESGT